MNPHVTILVAGSSGALKQSDVFDDVEPRYPMVMFHHETPCSVACERGKVQARILGDLTASAEPMTQLKLADAETMIMRSLCPMSAVRDPLAP